MKHKILLATDADTDFGHLLEDLYSLLNRSHQKYVSAFLVNEYQLEKVGVGAANGKDEGLGGLVANIERELELERKASAYNMTFEVVHGVTNSNRLSSLSTVFDLMVWELSSFQNCDKKTVKKVIKSVKCPILFLPQKWEIENLIIMHDRSLDSVKMMKGFLNMFNTSLRQLPLSVLVPDPDNTHQIESEKVFIDYLKMFFDNIGIQLIYQDPMKGLEREVVFDSAKPLLMFGSLSQEQIDNKDLMKFPTLLFKG